MGSFIFLIIIPKSQLCNDKLNHDNNQAIIKNVDFDVKKDGKDLF